MQSDDDSRTLQDRRDSVPEQVGNERTFFVKLESLKNGTSDGSGYVCNATVLERPSYPSIPAGLVEFSFTETAETRDIFVPIWLGPMDTLITETLAYVLFAVEVDGQLYAESRLMQVDR